MTRCGITIALVLVAAAGAQPVVRTVELEAPSGVPSTMAPGARVVVVGAGFGDKPSVRIRPFDQATEFDVEVLVASPVQIVMIAPRTLPVGAAYLVVESGGVRSQAFLVSIADRLLTLYTRDGAAFGPAVAYYPGLNRFDSPARPGERISLLATGLGRSSRGVRVLIEAAKTKSATEPEFRGRL